MIPKKALKISIASVAVLLIVGVIVYYFYFVKRDKKGATNTPGPDESGNNSVNDIKELQKLLNKMRDEIGIAEPYLDVDGIIGKLTGNMFWLCYDFAFSVTTESGKSHYNQLLSYYNKYSYLLNQYR